MWKKTEIDKENWKVDGEISVYYALNSKNGTK